MSELDEMGEIVAEFLVESYENLDQLDRDLVALEQAPESRELLSSIFRTIHTIKGTSGFLAFGQLERVTHVGENLLSRLRDGVLRMTPATTDALLLMVDTVRALLAEIEASGGEGLVDVTAACQAVQACLEPGAAPAAQPAPAAEPEPAVAEAVEEPEPEEPEEKLGELLVHSGAASSADVASAIQKQLDGDDRKLGELLVEQGKVEEAVVEKGLDEQQKRTRSESSVRVDVDLLDSLMRLVGELVLSRNQVVRHAASQNDVGLLRMTQRLNIVTAELQEGVMKTRMQPMDHIWSKLPRVVRDLSSTLGKNVQLQMIGKETELDRTLLEAIKDPLTHIVRNAVDHGIETPDKRTAAGKSAAGTLQLRAFHEGGRVIVEIRDDGAGIDPAKVGRKGLERGLVTADQLAAMSPRDITSLVFRPGFSTAEKVTNVSGRGVGMDVVKTNIEKIGGTVEIDSVPGKGSTFRLTIPLTLAIVPALTIECSGELYALPQISVVELVSVSAERAATAIEHVSGAPVYRLRGRLLPLVRLDEVLQVAPRDPALGAASAEEGDGDLVIAVLHAEGRRFGLVVDRVLNSEEIVVKPLSSRLKSTAVYSGATLLGDGRVALILDALAISQAALSGRGTGEDVLSSTTDEAGDTDRFLIAAVGDGRRVAIPLDMVTRLEQFPVNTIEHVGRREVVRYRGEIIPLLRLSSHLGAGWGEEHETVDVVVSTYGRRSVALIVESIDDIVEDVISARSDIDDMGLLGSAVIQERVTELLDVRQAILAADPFFFQTEGEHDSARSLQEA